MTDDTATAPDAKSSSDGPIRITVEIERPAVILDDIGPHARGAVREALKTLRSALDVALRLIEEEFDAPSSPGPTRIKIE